MWYRKQSKPTKIWLGNLEVTTAVKYSWFCFTCFRSKVDAFHVTSNIGWLSDWFDWTTVCIEPCGLLIYTINSGVDGDCKKRNIPTSVIRQSQWNETVTKEHDAFHHDSTFPHQSCWTPKQTLTVHYFIFILWVHPLKRFKIQSHLNSHSAWFVILNDY